MRRARGLKDRCTESEGAHMRTTTRKQTEERHMDKKRGSQVPVHDCAPLRGGLDDVRAGQALEVAS
eukprot:CAMPEP_0175483992 /NCGR_PEP_ID=MMETSP0095-20121207/79766_1 /TAXON_ID=311494 /ORGANISM="Alexandrium monilatum, Strain CCMP3105" /LENGTH=65 /DNA_ID=CAMNT_0016785703 /DNA_START=16 /DNA_END=210 /DNA_ORIENTATION=+